MNRIIYLSIALISLHAPGVNAQQQSVADMRDPDKWLVYNRRAGFDGDVVSMNTAPGDGLAILKGSGLRNGTIDIDIKGRDIQGQSFVGVAFHGVNDSTFDAIYFRPFNFRSPERKGHSVQYISHPKFTWDRLREQHPGAYEKEVNPVPDPNGWFHATVEITYPHIKVFVNHSTSPSLEVDQLSSRTAGWIALWVGNYSEGAFRNLVITPK